mmetsp:Transcript_103482/g.183826  ORF Transcript_103482/g.183826 Transcript_103482/m.183826 type:complete len:358 (-) Transcript_103482:156-1229(-)|eukprot:CAMPEP_0197628050 /NCGR_PEP_ID=MMETSP1338-20131121/6479_1 /TAXON_ID=43686 ORGANISM="Pelagodinium beii, Strain RCC1491" /NCGR_SAMPLE_ID=MMETSP1338 /ASSEMBLY_ACC=CAM_ASM_000754 /LENGTH=357 /DNA_ID=CAMNT_0043198931 /DNA_START=57 /DNA_END=1130 /DNA_ORIENTATION=+
MASHAVPVIDLAPFIRALRQLRAEKQNGSSVTLPDEARKVARQWREAFAKYGFCSIVGHGVPDDIIEKVYSVAREFFSLPTEQKMKCDLGKGYGAGGYTAQGKERVSATASETRDGEVLGAKAARPPDRVESMIVHGTPEDVIPDSIADYKVTVHKYHEELVNLLLVIMALTACSLDLDFDYFDSYFVGQDGTRKCDGSLRLAYYPAFKEGEEPLPGQLRYGEHTDYTGYTILWQDHNSAGPQTAKEGLSTPPGGLQVRMPDGTFADCPPVPGAFTVNAGDLIQVWTNDELLSNTHRVANPPPGDRSDRISLVFFTGPAADTVIEALPTCRGPRQPAKYPRITAGEHLKKKLAASNK